MADVTSTIQKFYEVAQKRDFSRDCFFRVLSISFGDGSKVKFDEDDLVYAKGGKVPGRNITNQQVPFMGMNFNVSGTVQYPGSESYSLDFYCDEKSIIHDKLEAASREVFDDETSTGNYHIAKASAVMDLVQLDPDLNIVKHYQLIGLAVRNVGEMTYTYDGNGKPVTFNATFSYHFYKTIK